MSKTFKISVTPDMARIEPTRSFTAIVKEPPMPESTCVETLVIGPWGGKLTKTVYEQGGFRAVAYRSDGSIAGDSDYGDSFDVTVYSGNRAVVKITKRGEWWKRP